MKMQNYRQKRRGAILVLAAVFMVLMFALLAFAVDMGYLYMVRTQLQRTADAAAIAATWSLLDGELATGQNNSPYAVSSARDTADQYTQLNKVLNSQPTLAQSDITVGYLSNPFNPNLQLDLSGSQGYNAVQVRVRRTTDQNGVVPLFFARVLGIDQAGSQALATAAFVSSVSGFQEPADGSKLAFLPFALYEDTWDALMIGQGTDSWKYNPDTKEVSSGPDGIKELNLYPQDTDSSGNSGTIDIGNPNNSTRDLSRQIQEGLNHEDLSYSNGKIELNADGVLDLNGDTGISAGIKDDLAYIKGQPRILPLYRSVSGNGNNAQYVIVRFVGVRIMDVDLTGSKKTSKRVIIQPATVYVRGGIPGGSGQTSTFIYSPISLVR